ncbi:MAG: uridine kinase [Actinomycetota bacterium]|nr:uridine kinase [Actinomycetota bacterium]
MTGAYRPVDPGALPSLLAAHLAAAPVPGRALRVALDGPRCAAEPAALADSLLAALRARGRAADHIVAEWFWRDASLRFEYGREDVESLPDWLDAAALRREVLDPLGPDGSGSYLPSLRDPVTNRATRAPVRQAPASAIVIVSGELLLGQGLPFDVAVHLSMSPAGRARRTPGAARWSLPAFDHYDTAVRPVELADVVIRVDDRRHPAVRLAT